MSKERLIIEAESNEDSKVLVNLHLSNQLILLSVVALSSRRTIKIIKEPFHPSIGLLTQVNNLLSLVKSFDYTSINLCVYQSPFSLLPSALFDENLLGKYLNVDPKEPEKISFFTKHLPQDQMAISTVVSSELISLLSKNSKQVSVTHFTDLMIQISSVHFKLNDNQLHAHLWDNQLTLLYFKGGRVNFLNQFYFQTAEDFLYHSLNCAEQLELDPANIKLILTGQVSIGTKIQELAYTYFGKTQFGNVEQEHIQRGAIQELPAHEYLYLFKHHLCA